MYMNFQEIFLLWSSYALLAFAYPFSIFLLFDPKKEIFNIIKEIFLKHPIYLILSAFIPFGMRQIHNPDIVTQNLIVLFFLFSIIDRVCNTVIRTIKQKRSF